LIFVIKKELCSTTEGKIIYEVVEADSPLEALKAEGINNLIKDVKSKDCLERVEIVGIYEVGQVNHLTGILDLTAVYDQTERED
jgi:hypothetical protein